MKSGFQRGDRKMRQQIRQAQLRGVCIRKTFHGITADIERGVKIFRTGPMPAAVGQRRKPARHHRNRGVATPPPGKSDEMIALWPAHIQGLIFAAGEDIGEFASELEQMPCPGLLEMAVRPASNQPVPIRILQRAEAACALGEVDRPPVVGIDERKIPELGALIEIRHARHRRLQRDLAERIQCAKQRQPMRERLQRIQEFARERQDRGSFR